MPVRVLLVEDDPRIVSFLTRGLAGEGYAVEVASDGRRGFELARSDAFAVVILDRMLPGMDGLEICRRLRQGGHGVLIVMLTARDALQDKIDALKGGADDYVTKPFAFGELLARIEALLRRSAPADRPSVLEVADLRVDIMAKTAWRGERRIPLTAREFALLVHLMENAGKVLSREQLLSDVWRLEFDPGTKVVEVYVRYLRRKIDEGEDVRLIRNVRGFGYTIADPASGDDPAD
jgi:two-component system OmpR family response regulator